MARCVLRHQEGRSAMKRILVPIDFSKPALRALDYAVALAKPLGADVTACFVVEPIYFAAPYVDGQSGALESLIADQRRIAVGQLSRLRRRYERRGVDLATCVADGIAAETIAAVATRLKAELIVIATHGRTGLSHLLLGSVAERVVRSAPCPVLPVRAAVRSSRRATPRRTAPAHRAVARRRAAKQVA